MKMTINLGPSCRTCRYQKIGLFDRLFGRLENAVCGRTAKQEERSAEDIAYELATGKPSYSVDYVTEKRMPSVQYTDCVNERLPRNEFHIGERCGPEGKFHSPQPIKKFGSEFE